MLNHTHVVHQMPKILYTLLIVSISLFLDHALNHFDIILYILNHLTNKINLFHPFFHFSIIHYMFFHHSIRKYLFHEFYYSEIILHIVTNKIFYTSFKKKTLNFQKLRHLKILFSMHIFSKYVKFFIPSYFLLENLFLLFISFAFHLISISFRKFSQLIISQLISCDYHKMFVFLYLLLYL